MTTGIGTLEEIRSKTGDARTIGLGDEIIAEFLLSDPSLSRALEEAQANFHSLENDMGSDVLALDEEELTAHLQSDYVNFYSAPTVNPYVAIAARGP